MKSEIREKIRIYQELEFPLLVKSELMDATTICNTVTTNCNTNDPTNSSNPEIQNQNMVGRKGPIWNFRWVGIRIPSFSWKELAS
jgi:hypothetical protein